MDFEDLKGKVLRGAGPGERQYLGGRPGGRGEPCDGVRVGAQGRCPWSREDGHERASGPGGVRPASRGHRDLAWVAEGKLDASITLSNKPWDTAVGVIIAREAGAKVMDRDGTDHTFISTATVATTSALAGEIAVLIETANGRAPR